MFELNRRNAVVTSLVATLASFIGKNTAKAADAPTSNADYRLQRLMPNVKVPRAITVIGCGGFGSWPAFFGAIAGVEEMLLIDASDTDEIDLARTPLRPRDVGRPKAEALRDLLLEYRPNLKLKAVKRFIEPSDQDIYFGEVLFDGTNYEPLSRALPETAKNHGMRFVHGFYNGSRMAVADHYPDGLKYRPGNELPVWVGTAAFTGALALHSALVSPTNFYADMNDLSSSAKNLQASILSGALDMDK